MELYLLNSPTTSNVVVDIGIDYNKNLCVKLLEKVAEACPGLSTALLLMGRVKMQTGDFNGALTALRKLLDTVDRTNIAGHLLMARILIKQGHYESASQTLEMGLSYNFKVRDDPVYHMILGTVSKENGDLEGIQLNLITMILYILKEKECNVASKLLGAVRNFETAMSFAGLRPGQDRSNTTAMSISDKATLYLELISAYAGLRKFAEATGLMDDVRDQLAGTTEGGRVIIGNAELCLEMDEIDRAIELLSSIVPGEPYYLQAHTKLADIYLNRRKDRQSFAKCFRYATLKV